MELGAAFRPRPLKITKYPSGTTTLNVFPVRLRITKEKV